ALPIFTQEVFEPGETLRLLEAERCTVFFAWPHQAEALIGHPRLAATRLTLRKGVGANTKWAAALYPPDHHAVGTYGMTETLPLCTAWPWDTPLALRAGSHGPPVGGKEIRIVDPESGRTLPAGREGAICVPGRTRGEDVAVFVVARAAVTEEELLVHCRVRLASYTVPRHLGLRREGELPEKASGKVDKAALRAEAARLLTAGGDRPESPPA